MKHLLLVTACIVLTASASSAQSFQIGAGGNIFFNPSPINDAYGLGFSVEAAGYIPAYEHIHLGISLGYSRNGLNETSRVRTSGGEHSALLATVRMQLKHDLPWARRIDALAVVGVGAAYRTIGDLTITIPISATIEGDSETNPLLIFGFGFQYSFSPVLGFYMLPEFHHIIIDGPDAQSFVPRMGLVFGRL